MKLHAFVPNGGGVRNKWVKLQLIVMMCPGSVKPLKEQRLGRTEAFEGRVVDAWGIRFQKYGECNLRRRRPALSIPDQLWIESDRVPL